MCPTSEQESVDHITRGGLGHLYLDVLQRCINQNKTKCDLLFKCFHEIRKLSTQSSCDERPAGCARPIIQR